MVYRVWIVVDRKNLVVGSHDVSDISDNGSEHFSIVIHPVNRPEPVTGALVAAAQRGGYGHSRAA